MDQGKEFNPFRSFYSSLTHPAKEGEKEPTFSIPLPKLPPWFDYQFRLPSPQWETFIKLQNLWALSHVLTILGTSTYVFAIISKNSLSWIVSYKLSVLGSIITYLVVLYRSNLSVEEEVIEVDESKTRMELVVETQRISVSELLKNENAQLLGYALLWLVTPECIFKILPFYFYSWLNITTFVTTEIVPDSALSLAVTPLLNYIEIPMLIGASHLDLLVYAVMLKHAWASKSAYALFIYSFIWILRFESSEASRTSLNLCVKMLDDLISPEQQAIYLIWKRVRWCLDQIVPLEKDIEKSIGPSGRLQSNQEEYPDSD